MAAESLESRTLLAASLIDAPAGGLAEPVFPAVLVVPGTRQVAQLRPEPVILAPVTGTFYRGGERIRFSGQATGIGGLPLSERFWQWRLVQVQPGKDRIIATIAGESEGSFLVPRSISADPGRPLAIQLLVRQPGSRFGRTQVALEPQLASLIVASTVNGSAIGVDGQAAVTPATVQRVAGAASRITASRFAFQNDVAWEFVRWSDGGSRSHRVLVPVSGRALTAFYQIAGSQTIFSTQLIQPA